MQTDDVKYTIRELKRGGIKATPSEYEKDVVLIKGFVVGDTRKYGISVVALDNAEKCLLSVGPSYTGMSKIRKILWRGYYTSIDQQPWLPGWMVKDPVCNYK